MTPVHSIDDERKTAGLRRFEILRMVREFFGKSSGTAFTSSESVAALEFPGVQRPSLGLFKHPFAFELMESAHIDEVLELAGLELGLVAELIKHG